MERPIGEIFDYNGKTLEVVKSIEDIENWYCTDCYFRPFISCTCLTAIAGHCSSGLRKDRTNVIFKEVKNGN